MGVDLASVLAHFRWKCLPTRKVLIQKSRLYLLDYLIAQGWIEVVGLYQVRDEVIAV